MKRVVFENFRDATLFSLASDKPSHQYVVSSGFRWKQGLTGNQSPYKGDVIYPLVPHTQRGGTNSTSLVKEITSYTPLKSGGQEGRVAFIFKNSQVWVYDSHNSDTITDGGTIDTGTDNLTNDICSFNGYLVGVAFGTYVKKRREDLSDSWTAFGSFDSPRFCETYNQYLYIGNKPSGIYGRLTQIKIFNTSFSNVGTLDLGTDFEIKDFRNINNDYILIVAKTAGSYCLLYWDGGANTSYSKIVPIDGEYVGMTRTSVGWVVVTKKDTINLYLLNGYQLEPLKTFLGSNNFPIYSNLNYKLNVAGMDNFIALRYKEGDILGENTYWFVIYDVEDKATYMRYFRTESGNTICGIGGFVDSVGNKYFWWQQLSNSPSINYLRKFPINTSGSEALENIYYYSNWLDLGSRVKIEKMEVIYDGQLNDNDDFITLKLFTVDNQTRDDYTETTIGTITNSSPKYRMVYDVGKTAERFKVMLTSHFGSASTWSGIIKKIVVYYNLIDNKI